MEENIKTLTMTFEPELTTELHDLAALEEVATEELVHELILEALEWREAIAQAAEECEDDADFSKILAKVLEQGDECGTEDTCE